MRSVTVIVPYFSGLVYLSSCLKAIRDSEIPLSSVLIVLNSPYGSEYPPKSIVYDAKLIDLEAPVGYARAINEGVATANTEFVCICDADAFVKKDCIPKLINALETDPSVKFVAPVLLSPRSGRIIDCGIGLTDYGHFHPWMDRRLEDFRKVQNSTTLMHWPAICSAVMVFRRDSFIEIGGFDHTYIDYFQDVDLCLRARQRGKAAAILPNAIAYHFGRSSGVHSTPKRIDMIAHHLRRHGIYWESWVKKILEQQFFFFDAKYQFPDDVIWIDISSLASDSEYKNEIERKVRLITIKAKKKPVTRDATELNLFSCVDHQSLESSLPVIYFTDRLLPFGANKYWIEKRAKRGDLVVDRHCNIVPLNWFSDTDSLGVDF